MSLPVDRLSSVLERFRVRTQLFHAGPLCGITPFEAVPGRGFLHVMRRGRVEVTHPAGAGIGRRLTITEPSLLFYPRALTHRFHNPPVEGSDFTCATLDFDGGENNPLVRALPPLIVLPLARVDGLDAALGLLFAETERVRCGQRVLADRLFEVVLIQLLRWLVDHPREAGVTGGLVAALADPRLARALSALHAQPGQAWTLAQMAAEAGMSRSAFAVAFRDQVGSTPAAYLAQWRIALAQTRLRAGEPVKLIAHTLGYANASALSRAFTQVAGCSPRAWLARADTPAENG